jgi:hypothetical protein
MQERFAGISALPLGGSADDFLRLIVAEAEKWADVIKAAGLKSD